MAMIYVGTSQDKLHAISRDPTTFEWGLQDISSADAGRTQAPGNPMLKMRLSQKRKIKLGWVMTNVAQTSEILRAFNPEYIYVRYFDPMDGALATRYFYTGDKSAPMKWYELPKNGGTKFATLSFDIIEV